MQTPTDHYQDDWLAMLPKTAWRARARQKRVILPEVRYQAPPGISMARKRLYHRQRGVCHYCGRHVPFDQSTLDHKTPKCRGRDDSRQNLTMACKECNERKGDLPYETFLRMMGITTKEHVA